MPNTFLSDNHGLGRLLLISEASPFELKTLYCLLEKPAHLSSRHSTGHPEIVVESHRKRCTLFWQLLNFTKKLNTLLLLLLLCSTYKKHINTQVGTLRSSHRHEHAPEHIVHKVSRNLIETRSSSLILGVFSSTAQHQTHKHAYPSRGSSQCLQDVKKLLFISQYVVRSVL